MKYLLIAVSFVTISFVGYLYASLQNFVYTNEDFQKVLQSNPQKEVLATIFFPKGIKPESVHMLLRGKNVRVQAFRHSNVLGSGGYVLQDGEGLEQAIAAYKRDYVLFLAKRVELGTPMVTIEKNLEMQNALVKSQAKIDAERELYTRDGIRITAIEFVGSAQAVSDFKAQDASWQITEVMDIQSIEIIKWYKNIYFKIKQLIF